MALLIYTLCAITSAVCTYLLAIAYLRSRYKLLLWSAICFAGLTLNNLALWLDKLVFRRSISRSSAYRSRCSRWPYFFMD